MRRLALICAVALPLFGLTRPAAPGSRIGVLRMPDAYAWEPAKTMGESIGNQLRDELEARGFRPFDAAMTFDELRRRGAPDADYFVEIDCCSWDSRTSGAAGATLGPVLLNTEVVVSSIDATLRLYDGRTLEFLGRYDLQRKQRVVIPAGIGIGSHGLWVTLPEPFLRNVQFRSLGREIAREAADRIGRR